MGGGGRERGTDALIGTLRRDRQTEAPFQKQ